VPNLYYNPANYDSNAGGGYGVAGRPAPSFGKGSGSETIMGSSETGIYLQPSCPEVSEEEQEEFEEEFLGDSDDIDAFVAKINKWRPRFDPSRRADRASFVSNQPLNMGLIGEESLPNVMSGIAPFSNKTLYPKGFSGPPLGTGGASQAFRTTGSYKRTGTQFGTSRAPFNDPGEVDVDIPAYSFLDVIDPDLKTLLRQRIKILRLLNQIRDLA